jgi:hypothetical protein
MNDLRLPILILLLAGGVTCFAGDPPRASVELKGIVNTPKSKWALFEVAPRPGTPPAQRILGERERIDGLEVVKIDPRSGEVTIRQADEDRVLTLPRQPNGAGADSSLTPPTLDLRAAKLESVLDLYQEFAGRTVLRSPLLASSRLTVKTGPVPVDQAVKVLDQSLADSGVIIAPHGAKFVIAVPARDAPMLDALPAPPETIAASGNIIRPGMIKFTEADLWPVLAIYQDLTARTILHPTPLPAFRITVTSQTELTRAEAIHTLDVLFALGGLSTLREGDKFVFAVPARDVPRLSAISTLHPPERPQAAPSAGRADAAEHVMPADNLKFQEAPVSAALQVYADLAGRKALPLDTDFPNVKLSLRAQTPLTRSEALYALQAVATLNHVHFAFIGDKDVKAVFMPAMERDTPPNRAERF